MCFLQDDIVKFVSEPTSPPRLVEIPEEGKGKAKERREVGEGDDTVIVEDTSDEDDEETLQEQSRFSRDSVALDGPTSLSSKILQLAWRLVCLRRRGGRATWHASTWPRSSRSLRPHLKR
jgi:hypothetical protein